MKYKNMLIETQKHTSTYQLFFKKNYLLMKVITNKIKEVLLHTSEL